jgi:hypothetical protein
MPSAAAILTGLADIANAWRWLAITWHIILAALCAVLLIARTVPARVIAFALIAPVLSASLLGWFTGNPFNGAVLLALGIALSATATRRQTGILARGTSWQILPGAVLVAFGWTYPHFLTAASWVEYAYAAPLGLIPCPTLALVIGFTLAFPTLRSPAWNSPLIMSGLLYGMVGVFALDVTLDLVLLAGSLMLGALAVSERRRRW